jgi:RimJ/RimL family protein N-acetyltransferase
MSFGWCGEKTRLVPLDRAKHFENAILWLNDPETTEHLLTGDFPITRLAEEAYFERVMKESKEDVPFAIETPEGRHIGFIGLHGVQWQHRVGVCGIIVGDPEFRGRGYGSDALRVQVRHAFDVLALRMLMAEVMADNLASRKAMEKAGYREIASIPRRYWQRGEYRDALLFAQYVED